MANKNTSAADRFFKRKQSRENWGEAADRPKYTFDAYGNYVPTTEHKPIRMK